MFNAIGRKITGNPCIGCGVRDKAYYPEREYPAYTYVEGPEFNQHRYTAQKVVESCDLALGGLDLCTKDRFKACAERYADPDAQVNSLKLLWDNLIALNKGSQEDPINQSF